MGNEYDIYAFAPSYLHNVITKLAYAYTKFWQSLGHYVLTNHFHFSTISFQISTKFEYSLSQVRFHVRISTNESNDSSLGWIFLRIVSMHEK